MILLLQVIDEDKNIADIPRWFEGALLNYAEHALHWNDDRVALYACRESDNLIYISERK